MYSLIRTKKPLICLELGACLGISASYIGLALQKTGDGRLYSIEGASVLAELTKETVEHIDLHNTTVLTGSFGTVLPNILPEINPVDFVFIDGHHQGSAMISYFELIEPFLAADSIVLFDDLLWSRDMRSSWKEINTHPRIKHSVDLFTMGVCQMR